MVVLPHGGTIKGSLLPDVVSEMFSLSSVVQFLMADIPSTYGCHGRWLGCTQAVEANCDYVWILDNDMSIPPGALGALMNADKGIIGAAYNMRKMPLQTVVTMLTDHGMIEFAKPAMMPNEPFICHSIGFGCMLVKVEALKRIPQPWFGMTWDSYGRLSMTDDRWFSEQAAKVGIETWCDPTLEVKHIGDYHY
jgi:hypothetical protein